MTHPIHHSSTFEPAQLYHPGLIQTIKNIRAHYNSGLLEAKHMCDEYRAVYMTSLGDWHNVNPGHFNHWVETQWDNFNSAQARAKRSLEDLFTRISIHNHKFGTDYHLRSY